MKIGFTCGSFDLFHAGHVAMVAECKMHCDYLIVGIQTDPTIDRKNKNKPIQSIIERQVQVQACRYVDKTIVYDTEKDLIFLLSLLDVNIRFLGVDWEYEDYTGKDICEQRGIQIYFNSRYHHLSTTDLRKRLK